VQYVGTEATLDLLPNVTNSDAHKAKREVAVALYKLISELKNVIHGTTLP
jgi:hypothetical protein